MDAKQEFIEKWENNQEFVRMYSQVQCTYHGKVYELSNENLKAYDEVFPLSNGYVTSDNTYHHLRFSFNRWSSGFPDEPHRIVDLHNSTYKPYEIHTNRGYGPKEMYYKIVKVTIKNWNSEFDHLSAVEGDDKE